MSWERRPRVGLLIALRLRRVARLETTWSERLPWEPATQAPIGTRTLASALAEWEAGTAQVTAQWRSFAVGDAAVAGTRQLATLGWRRDLGRGWAGWAESSVAWGDPVDLVHGLVPLPGLVVARHWGRWRSEGMAGASFASGGLSLRLAAARRVPEPAAGSAATSGAPEWEGWVEATAGW